MSKVATISEIEKDIIESFSLFDSWDEKYEYIIELGKKLAPLPEKYRQDIFKVKGCQSTVWLGAELVEERVVFYADSDAVIVKGLISLLIQVLSNQLPQTIIDAKLDFLEQIGMMNHLAQTRSNGLVAMVKQMKNYAIAFKLKNERND